MGEKLSYDEVKSNIEYFGWELISTTYVGYSSKLELRCVCGEVLFKSYSCFIGNFNKKCLKCKAHDKFTISLNKKHGEKFKILDRVYLYSDIYTFYHKECDTEFKATANNILNRGICPYCEAKHTNYTTNLFKKRIKELTDDKYEVISEYTGNKNKILMKHKECSHEWWIQPNSFLCGVRCPKCKGGAKKEHLTFAREVNALVGAEYSILEVYVNTNTNISFRHNVCLNEWKVKPSHFLNGTRCPVCSTSSLGERTVRNFLNKNNINFTPQYRFEECKNIRPLPFDFAIFDNDENLIELIEFQGIQHFEPTNFNGIDDVKAQNTFEATKKSDIIKKDFCIKNNIKLTEITYLELKDTENILNRYNDIV